MGGSPLWATNVYAMGLLPFGLEWDSLPFLQKF